MKEPPHPGVSVRRDCLEAFGVSRKQLSALVNGRAGISPEMAIRLDKAFGGGASTWYQLQAAYDMAQALRRAGVGEEREEGGRRDGGLGVGGRTAW